MTEKEKMPDGGTLSDELIERIRDELDATKQAWEDGAISGFLFSHLVLSARHGIETWNQNKIDSVKREAKRFRRE